MPRNNPATTDVNEIEIVGVPIQISAAKSGTVLVRRDVADYFNITVSVNDQSFKLITRNYSGRKVFGGLWDTAGTDSVVGVGNQSFYLPLSLGKRGGGRVIVIPTELTYTKGSGPTAKTLVRQTSLRFPSGAILSQISDWLATKCTTKTPKWFKSPTGRKYIVAAKGTITDLNPGDESNDGD